MSGGCRIFLEGLISKNKIDGSWWRGLLSSSQCFIHHCCWLAPVAEEACAHNWALGLVLLSTPPLQMAAGEKEEAAGTAFAATAFVLLLCGTVCVCVCVCFAFHLLPVVCQSRVHPPSMHMHVHTPHTYKKNTPLQCTCQPTCSRHYSFVGLSLPPSLSLSETSLCAQGLRWFGISPGCRPRGGPVTEPPVEGAGPITLLG